MRAAPVSSGVFIKFENGIFSLHLPGSQSSGLKLPRVTQGGTLRFTREGHFLLFLFILEHLKAQWQGSLSTCAVPATWDASGNWWLLHSYCLTTYPLPNVCVFIISVKALPVPSNEVYHYHTLSWCPQLQDFPSHRPISNRLSDLTVLNSNQDGQLPPHRLYYRKLPRKGGRRSLILQARPERLPRGSMPIQRPPCFQDTPRSPFLRFILWLLPPSDQGPSFGHLNF